MRCNLVSSNHWPTELGKRFVVAFEQALQEERAVLQSSRGVSAGQLIPIVAALCLDHVTDNDEMICRGGDFGFKSGHALMEYMP
jgi:hypothetical protein